VFVWVCLKPRVCEYVCVRVRVCVCVREMKVAINSSSQTGQFVHSAGLSLDAPRLTAANKMPVSISCLDLLELIMCEVAHHVKKTTIFECVVFKLRKFVANSPITATDARARPLCEPALQIPFTCALKYCRSNVQRADQL